MPRKKAIKEPSREEQLTLDNAALRAESKLLREQLTTLQESECLARIAEVMNKYNCQLVPLPDGRVHVKARG